MRPHSFEPQNGFLRALFVVILLDLDIQLLQVYNVLKNKMKKIHKTKSSVYHPPYSIPTRMYPCGADIMII